MTQGYFAVLFHAFDIASNGIHLSVEFTQGKSKKAVIKEALRLIKKDLPAEKGWSQWGVDAKRISSEQIAQVNREADWSDQTGAHHLYAFALLCRNKKRMQFVFVVGSSFTWNVGCFVNELAEYIQKMYPASDGWDVAKQTSQEWDEVPRRTSQTPQPTWSQSKAH